MRFRTVLADAGYGLSGAFRQGLSARGLTWADTLSTAAETILPASTWKKVSWRRSTKGRLTARFAALRIRIADGSPQHILDKGQQYMPGEEAWLVGEWRSNDERKYYLSNLPAEATLKQLAAAIKARWVCEQAHQQMKEELGLDHFEGRSRQGLHQHALMTMIAYAFLQHQRLNKAKREKRKRPGPPKPTLPAIRHAVIAALSSHRTLQRCPRCRTSFQMTSNSILPKSC